MIIPNVNKTEIKLQYLNIAGSTLYKLIQSFRKAIWPHVSKPTKNIKTI